MKIYERGRGTRIAVIVHLVWSTYRRMAMIGPDDERDLHRSITAEAQGLGATVLAVNGMPGHIHLVVLLPATLSVSRLIQQVKGASARRFNTSLSGHRLRWGDGYAAFSLSRSHRNAAIAYVRNQKEHHEQQILRPGWEDT